MSEKIQVKVKSKNAGVKLKSTTSGTGADLEAEDDFFQKQLQNYYQLGLIEGEKNTKAELERSYTEKLLIKYEELNSVITSLKEKINSYEEEFERLVMETSLVVSETILKREIERETIVGEVLKASLKKVLGANEIIVKLNPEELTVMHEENKKSFSDGTTAKIKFEPDERIAKGGCLVISEIGNVDGRISSQLAELKKILESNFSQQN